MANDKSKLTLSVSEAASELGISTRTMYELLRRSDCTYCMRIGRKLRIINSAFEAYILEQAGNISTLQPNGRQPISAARR